MLTFGKFKGQPVAAMRSQYLLWLTTRDDLRFTQADTVLEALQVLRSRFETFGDLLAELKLGQRPDYWTPERAAQQKEAKAEKMRQLKQRRQEERLARREAWRIAREQADMQRIAAQVRQRFGKATPPVNTEPTAEVLMDASYFVRKARLERKADTDVSDLI